MTIFKSRQVNLDPEPYFDGTFRSAYPTLCEYDPRPEFEPTRDPYPWLYSYGDRSASNSSSGSARWVPRREQFDTPVNRVLEAFRADDAGEALAQTAIGWLNGGSMGDGYATPDEIDHARKVLTRLAAI